jgi:hypothetical protein
VGDGFFGVVVVVDFADYAAYRPAGGVVAGDCEDAELRPAMEEVAICEGFVAKQ